MHISKKSIVSMLLCCSFMLAMFTFLAPVKTEASNLKITLDPGHGYKNGSYGGNGYVTAEIIHSTARARQEALAHLITGYSVLYRYVSPT